MRVWFACAIVGIGGVAHAQPPPEPPPPEEPPPEPPAPDPPPEPAPPPPASQAELDALKAEMQALRAAHDKMKAELADVKRRQSEQITVLPPPKGHKPRRFPLRPVVDVTLRYDHIFLGDELDRYEDDAIEGLRMRVHAGLLHDHRDSAVIGGVRFSLGGDPNPTDPFISVGDGFRTAGVGLDRYWASFRPFEDRTLLRLTMGKMPLPFWRGDRGTFASELLWDDDISPVGVAAEVKLFDLGGFKAENTVAYFVLHDIEDLRFQGLTGPISLIADQLRIGWTYVTGAFAFYDYENLNSGLHATTGSATPAFLLGPGFQATNNSVSHGPGAQGFSTDAFRIINPSLQGHIPLPIDDLGKGSEVYLLVDFSHNLAVERDQNGIGGSAGFETGDFEKGWLNPFELWFTYRYVEADATLATLTDSDLGGGTAYRGFEIGASYDVHESVRFAASYFDFLANPFMDEQVRRVWVDAIWSY